MTKHRQVSGIPYHKVVTTPVDHRYIILSLYTNRKHVCMLKGNKSVIKHHLLHMREDGYGDLKPNCRALQKDLSRD